jgi:hypothetical protein
MRRLMTTVIAGLMMSAAVPAMAAEPSKICPIEAPAFELGPIEVETQENPFQQAIVRSSPEDDAIVLIWI